MKKVVKKVTATLAAVLFVGSMTYAYVGPTGPNAGPEAQRSWKLQNCKNSSLKKCKGIGSTCASKANPC